MTLNKGTVLQNPIFWSFYSHFVQNQVTAPCHNHSAFFFFFFFVNPNDTSKIRDRDDANRLEKIFLLPKNHP